MNEGANPLHSQVRTCYEPRQAPGTSTKDSFIRIPFVNKSSVAGAIFGCVVEEHFKIYPYLCAWGMSGMGLSDSAELSLTEACNTNSCHGNA